jgi:lambda family phage portal protein
MLVRQQSTVIQRARRWVASAIAGNQSRRIEAVAGPYQGGDRTRLTKGWQPARYSGDRAIGEGWDLLTDRIRDLQRNAPAIIALRRTLVDHIFALGIGMTANVTIAGELEDQFNVATDEKFEWWAEHEADVRGKTSWYDQQRQFGGEVFDAGECLLLRCHVTGRRARNRQVPLAYQVVEAEQIDSSKDWLAGNGRGSDRRNRREVRRGIEVDRDGFPTAYYLFDVHPGDGHAIGRASVRVPAEYIQHVILPGRPSATRGISLYASVTQPIRDTDTYLGAELTAANIGALFTLVLKTENPGAGFGFVGDGTDETPGADGHGNPTVKLGHGIVSEIGRKDDIEQVSANRPNSNAGPFLDLLTQQMCMAGNVSRYRMTRDYRATTYVSARAAHLDDQRAFEPMQRYFGRTLCKPVRYTWIEQMVAINGMGGLITASHFAKQRRRWLATELEFGGLMQIDPDKETNADRKAVEACFTTQKAVCRRRGENWRHVYKQRQREQEYAAELGIEPAYGVNDAPALAETDYESAVPDKKETTDAGQ